MWRKNWECEKSMLLAKGNKNRDTNRKTQAGSYNINSIWSESSLYEGRQWQGKIKQVGRSRKPARFFKGSREFLKHEWAEEKNNISELCFRKNEPGTGFRVIWNWERQRQLHLRKEPGQGRKEGRPELEPNKHTLRRNPWHGIITEDKRHHLAARQIWSLKSKKVGNVHDFKQGDWEMITSLS